MANVETDKLGLVEMSSVKGGWFGKTIRAAEHFCLVVFRGDTYLGTVLPEDVRTEDAGKRVRKLGARDGDTVYRINLGPKSLELSGTVTTRDHFQRAYWSRIELKVTNISAFARLYRQGSDPVQMAIYALRRGFQDYAGLKKHDDLDRTQLPFHLPYALRPDSSTGLSVSNVYELTLALDPNVKAIRDIERATEVEKAKKGQAAVLSELDREEQTRVFEDTRAKKKMTDADEREKELLDKIASRVSTALAVRIQQELDNGVPLDEALAQYPQLMDLYLPPGGSSNAARIAAPGGPRAGRAEALPPGSTSALPAGSAASSGALASGQIRAQPTERFPSGAVQPGVFTEPPEDGAAQLVTNDILGLELTMKALKLQECEKAGLPEGSRALKVTDVEEDGLADRAGVKITDYLLQMNDKPLQDANDINSLLNQAPLNTEIKLLVLRKSEPDPITLHVKLG